jgi:hypothetical protein
VPLRATLEPAGVRQELGERQEFRTHDWLGHRRKLVPEDTLEARNGLETPGSANVLAPPIRRESGTRVTLQARLDLGGRLGARTYRSRGIPAAVDGADGVAAPNGAQHAGRDNSPDGC